jgi:hypothetical protein
MAYTTAEKAVRWPMLQVHGVAAGRPSKQSGPTKGMGASPQLVEVMRP